MVQCTDSGFRAETFAAFTTSTAFATLAVFASYFTFGTWTTFTAWTSFTTVIAGIGLHFRLRAFHTQHFKHAIAPPVIRPVQTGTGQNQVENHHPGSHNSVQIPDKITAFQLRFYKEPLLDRMTFRPAQVQT